MKTIALEQVDQRLTEALKQQPCEDPILLTKGSEALGLLLRLPEETKDWDVACWLDDPVKGRVLVIIEAKHGQPHGTEVGMGPRAFGSCKGMMSIVSEDDEHLKDFEEYMR